MLGSWPPSDFPLLDANNHAVTSKSTRRYNCIAWAAGDTARKWWPDNLMIGYWPTGVPREETMDAFVQAYGTLGYAVCLDPTFEQDTEKVALFGVREAGVVLPTHAAIQLESGQWSSKLGDFEDIRHDPVDVVTGPLYGEVVYFLARPRPPIPHPANLLSDVLPDSSTNI